MKKITNHKRVLVTGGAGFLGSHLCDRLVADGCDVLCADNFFSGTKDNIAHLIGNPRFELLRHDVTFPLYVEVDEIYNLACPASPLHYQYDPVQTTKTSVHGAINTVYGDGKQTRSFCYVDDLIDAFVRLMATSDDFTGPVNLGNPQEFTILELARKVIANTGSRSEIVFKPLPSDDPMQRQPDISLAKQMLQWEPKVALNEGLRRTISYFGAGRRPAVNDLVLSG